jgi:hypothetical protein
MAVRSLVTDAAWAEIAPRLAAIKHKACSPPELRDRLFIGAVLLWDALGVGFPPKSTPAASMNRPASPWS